MCASTTPPPPPPPSQTKPSNIQKDGASRGTYTTLPPSLISPAVYSVLPPTMPFADQQIPGVTPHSLTIHTRNLKYLEKLKEDEEKRAKKFRDRSNKEKARSEKHVTIAAKKAEQGKDRRAAHHQKKAAKLKALSTVHHKAAQCSQAEFCKAKGLSELPPRPTLPSSSEGTASS